MDAEMKAKLESEARKHEYKQLLEIGSRAMENSENNTIAENMEMLTDLVCKSDQLIATGSIEDRVGQSSEVVLDAQVVKLAHDLLGATVHKIESEAFDEDEFVAGLRNFLKDDDGKLDFSRLDPIWCKFVKRFRFSASLFSHMNFNYDAETTQPTQATQRQRRQNRREDFGVAKKPTTQQQRSTVPKKRKVDKVLDQINAIYKGTGSRAIPYYALIIDPTNMMYTFDNSFQVSFLFRDGFVSFEKGDDGYPAIRPVARINREEVDPDKETVSFATTLNNEIIQAHIKRYNIREPMIKIDRDEEDDADVANGTE